MTMIERPSAVTFNGAPLTLLGPVLAVGDPAPDCALIRHDMKPVRLSDWFGKKLLISSIPSLDTPVCDTQTRRFNAEAAARGFPVLTVSMDLPFAQSRWCGAAGISAVTTLSDYLDMDFGLRWGLLIRELRLLTRAVALVSAEGVIRYLEVVPEVSQALNYDAVLEAARKL